MSMLLQTTINGIVIGSAFSLVALGLTMIWGIMHISNFAHGSFYMIGGYVIWTIITLLGVDFWLAILITAVVMAIFGAIVERLTFRPAEGPFSTPLSSLIVSIGLIMIFNNSVLAIWGARPETLGAINIQEFHFLNVTVTLQRVLIVVAAVILIALLQFFLKRTTLGMSIEATAQNEESARLMGINTSRVGSIVFAMGVSLAAIAAGLMAPLTNINIGMGDHMTTYGFVIIILGGMGSIPGAIIGGFILGLISSLSATYLTANYYEVIVFGVLILILAIKPTGLFGAK